MGDRGAVRGPHRGVERRPRGPFGRQEAQGGAGVRGLRVPSGRCTAVQYGRAVVHEVEGPPRSGRKVFRGPAPGEVGTEATGTEPAVVDPTEQRTRVQGPRGHLQGRWRRGHGRCDRHTLGLACGTGRPGCARGRGLRGLRRRYRRPSPVGLGPEPGSPNGAPPHDGVRVTADAGARSRRFRGRRVPAGRSSPLPETPQRGVKPCRAGPRSPARVPR